MFRTLAKILKICFYAVVILAGVTFAISNRGKVDLTFYPMPFVVSMPLFLFTIAVFSLGLLLGWMLARVKTLGSGRAHKQASKRITALENELGTLRSEKLANPTVALPRK